MHPHTLVGSAVVVLALGMGGGGPAVRPRGSAGAPALPEVQANDNRAPAGERHGDTLALRLSVVMARWHPESDADSGVAVAAWAEEGKAPSIPAPLIRAPEGTIVVASVRNALGDSSITLYGLSTHPAASLDTITIRPGDSATVRFPVGAAGTYLYWARLGAHHYGTGNEEEREQLGGALVVDPPGPVAPDRIFVINIWGRLLDSTTYANALTINGHAWPYDERISATVGDTLRWRVINASDRNHPMHLHGFYYRVDSRGDVLTDTAYAADRRWLAVTQRMRPFTTMLATWSPDRPGDWIFHCHIAFHVVPEAARLEAPDSAMHARMSDDPRVHMAGLVLGIAVAPSAGWKAPARRHPRAMRLYIQQAAAPRGRAPRSLGYVLQSGSKPPAADSVVIPAPTLVLTRGQPTDITVINRLGETAAIHWHGVELESWSDGVAGWSGLDSMHAATAVAPGDSFVAHLTLPRAGTFLYHTHMNDLAQLTAGLYGAIVVLPPGQRFDPARDHVFITGWDGPGDTPERLLVNGDSASAPLEIRAGVHRMRFGNIGPADAWVFRVVRDTSAESWRAIAKDGADLPPALATEQPAAVTLDVGETADFAWHPAPGEYRLTVSRIGKPVRYERRIVVR